MLIKLPLIDQYQINPGTEMVGTVELFYLGKSDFGEKRWELFSNLSHFCNLVSILMLFNILT